jgi:hypothetical protein
MKTRLLRIAFAGVAACASAAAEGSLNGPVAAMLYDSATRSFHAVPGIPGAAYVGAAIADGVNAAAFAPNGLVGLYTKDGGLYLARPAADGSWTSSRLIDAGSEQMIVWAQDSAAAAIIDAGTVTFRRADGSLTGHSAGVAGQIAAAAVDGARLVAAVISDSASGIYLFESGAEAKLLARADRPVSVAVAGADVVFADRARNEVWLLRDYRNGTEPRLVANVDDPVGVAAAGGAVIYASAASRKVVAVKASGEPVFELALDFEPTGVERFGNSGWLLNPGTSGPLQVLVGGREPAVYFVPRGQEGSERAQ